MKALDEPSGETPSRHQATICLTFDNMGSAYDVGQRSRAAQDPDDRSLSDGYPAVLAVLAELGLRATFFIEGWNTLHNAGLIQEVLRRGHEVGLHGWVHERFKDLAAVDVERIMLDSYAGFKTIGVTPVGFRAPGGERGDFVLPVIQRLGLAFDSSVEPEAVATEPHLLDTGLPNIPWRWELIDYYQYYMHPDGEQTPPQYEALLFAALDEAIERRGTMTPIFHAHVSGVEAQRLAVLTRFLTTAAADDRVRILPASVVAAGLSDQSDVARSATSASAT